QKSSQQSYEFHFRYFKKGPLSIIKMEHLNSKAIHAWLSWLKKQPKAKNVSRKSFKHELKSLIAILNWYRNFVDEDFNVPITKQHRQICYYKRVPPKRPDYYARPEELRAWIKWLKESRKKSVYYQLATFMLLTGARVGEACGMLWSAIDFKQGVARVIRIVRWDHKTRKPHLEDTAKTESSIRLLVLSDELIEILKQMEEQAQNDLVFTDSKGGALKYRAIQSAFNTGFTALKLPWRSTHILRHSYATMALISTKNLSSVQASLGHSSSRMTERYAKVIALLDRDIAQKTTKAFNLFGSEREESLKSDSHSHRNNWIERNRNMRENESKKFEIKREELGTCFKNHSENHSENHRLIKFETKKLVIPVVKSGVPYGK
ncbi:MAG: site-specific integrase, partial [Bdellovibrionaceae bacterium]|nr:site-specific integrase [Pseudobdellovibrionaceae bacterium]